MNLYTLYCWCKCYIIFEGNPIYIFVLPLCLVVLCIDYRECFWYVDSELYVHCNALVYLVLTHTVIGIAVVLVYIYISGMLY